MSWYQLLDIAEQARECQRAEVEWSQQACPRCGEPLQAGPNGELHCSFDGFLWSRDSVIR